MNTANKLTLARIVLIPFFLLFALPPVALLKGGLAEFFAQWGKTVALIIFILASVTDLLDGHIARRQNTITNTGKFLDPLADKLLISAAMIALVATRELSGWICFLIFIREFAVTGIRTIAASAGYVIAANNWEAQDRHPNDSGMHVLFPLGFYTKFIRNRMGSRIDYNRHIRGYLCKGIY